MTKFIKALKAQINPNARKRVKPISFLDYPMRLTEEVTISYPLNNTQMEYLLRLNWNVSVWIDDPVDDLMIEKARKSAMNELSRIVYSEIENKVREIKYHIEYGETKKVKVLIDQLLDIFHQH